MNAATTLEFEIASLCEAVRPRGRSCKNIEFSVEYGKQFLPRFEIFEETHWTYWNCWKWAGRRITRNSSSSRSLSLALALVACNRKRQACNATRRKQVFIVRNVIDVNRAWQLFDSDRNKEINCKNLVFYDPGLVDGFNKIFHARVKADVCMDWSLVISRNNDLCFWNLFCFWDTIFWRSLH